MNKIIVSIFVLLIFSFINLLKAQVVVGSGDKLAGYSLLQVDHLDSSFPNGGGVQLPRIDASGKIALNAQISANPTQAAGLTIYNTENKKVECWNGSAWIPIPNIIEPVFNATNGLTKSYNVATHETTVKLGTTPLVENTTIALRGNTLEFTKEKAARFQITNNINNPAFVVTQDKVGIGTSNPQAKLHIVRPAGDNTYPFRLADGTQGSNYVLTSKDIYGNAQWSVLPAIVSAYNQSVNGIIGATNLGSERRLSEAIECQPGKWLIIGHFGSQLSTADSKLYAFAKIRKVTVNGSGNVTGTGDILAVAGVIAEPSGSCFSMPEVIYYGEFDQLTYVALFGQSPGTTSQLNSWSIVDGKYGYLSAIQLAE